jgi:hypothetical protein
VVSVTDLFGLILGFQWLKHYTTNRKVAGSIPDELIFLNLPNRYGNTRPSGLIGL